MSHYIYAKTEKQQVTSVGCSKTADIPANAILLQVVERHPELQWVKWSIRFRRTLKENRALGHPYAKYFKNPSSLTRLLEDKDFAKLADEQNAAFHKFHEDNQHVLEELLEAARQKKNSEGRKEYSVDQILGEIRWSDTEIDRGDEKVKINGRWSAWYSRALQMLEPEPIGFFAVRSSIANGLVWNGCTWQEFASEHDDQIDWNDPFYDLPDGDWEHSE
jgi:hypothetical protein